MPNNRMKAYGFEASLIIDWKLFFEVPLENIVIKKRTIRRNRGKEIQEYWR
jgi:hypothetical protein